MPPNDSEPPRRFAIESELREGEQLLVLRDRAGSASATIWPAFGCNCLGARLPAPDGQVRDVLLSPPSLDDLRRQPSWWGIPLLFPWPGRIPQGMYEFAGRIYRLPALDAGGAAIHGFVKDRPWRVERAEASETAAEVTATCSSDDHPETLEGFPFPYRLSVTFRLTVSELELDFEVSNPGAAVLPFGLGAHPYLLLPLGPQGRRETCLVQVPAARRWRLDTLRQLTPPAAPSEPLSWEEVTEPVSGAVDLRVPQALGDRLYDDVFTSLAAAGGESECLVAGPDVGLASVVRASAAFPTLVVYTPPGRPAICFEPWTAPPNVFNLAARGLDRSGLMLLAPGAVWRGTMRLLLRSWPAPAGRHGPSTGAGPSGEPSPDQQEQRRA